MRRYIGRLAFRAFLCAHRISWPSGIDPLLSGRPDDDQIDRFSRRELPISITSFVDRERAEAERLMSRLKRLKEKLPTAAELCAAIIKINGMLPTAEEMLRPFRRPDP